MKPEGSGSNPPSAMFVDPTEDGIALDFAERNRERLKYDHHLKKWLSYDGIRWKLEETQLAFDEARKILREHNQRQPSASLPKMRTAYAVEKFAQADRRLAVTSSRWDQEPWKLCTPGGTVDLKTGQLSKNDPLDYITKCCSVTPNIMPTILWDRFLYETTEGDERLIRFLRMMAGYCLTGFTIEHALFFIYGLGGNGKGVFVNTIAAILNDYHVAANMDVFTQSKYDRHPTELARLHGARMVTASETEEGKSWAESRIKQITGGDPIAARFMRGDFFEFTPQFKLVFLGNHKPILHNVDDAARRRFNIIPFVNKPVRPDKDLPEKLKDEYPGILQWMIEGCLDWQANGLIKPDVVQAETEAYFDDQDIFSQWLEECTTRKYETTGETSSRLFESWKRWARQQG
ncbi:MAG: phage/plasmid primase, P4 family, partial [Chloroflexota bacterium]|nr:phage/plasmid primase, P4 family [Chloroflexota bacterium]